MFRAHHEKNRRAATIALESLEDRVVLTAGAASVEIQYLRAINHVNSLLQRRVGQIQGMLIRGVARADQQYAGTLARAAARLGVGPAQARTARVEVARATATAENKTDRVVGQADGQIGRFTAQFDHRLASVTSRFGKLSAVIRGANPYFAADFKNALTGIDTGIPAEGQAAQATVQAATGPVQSAVAQAATSGASAEAQAEAAAGELADASGSQLAGERAAVAEFWDRYYSAFNPLRAEMAAIASAQLPPVHLRRGVVTGPEGNGGRTGINGTGPRTQTFVGIPGGVVTTGLGFGFSGDITGIGGLGNGSTGTVGTGTVSTGTVGTGTGTGTTTLTGTGTTGVGATGTAGNGANSNSIGSTTGAVANSGTTTGSMTTVP
jgi:cytochrome c556